MKTLRHGDESQAVVEMQKRLRDNGWELKCDGIFGPITEDTLTDFQAANDLKPDGICGARTWAALLIDKSHQLTITAENEGRLQLFRQIPEGISEVQTEVIRAALSDLNYREIPNGSNSGDEIYHIVNGYNEHHRILGPPPPWCAIACCQWIRRGLHVPDWESTPFGAWYGAVSQIMTWSQHNGAYGTTPLPASVFMMGRIGSGSDRPGRLNAGHCGIVLAADGDEFISIEGNTGNQVASRRRKVADVLGFCYWWK